MNGRSRIRVVGGVWLASAVFLVAGCTDDPVAPEEGIRTYEFAIRGRGPEAHFLARTSVADVIADVEAQLALPEDERNRFPNGPIAAGDGGYNDPWSWHYATDRWELTDFAIEVCDGNPQLVEDDLGYWLDTVGQFCPWGAYVLRGVSP